MGEDRGEASNLKTESVPSSIFPSFFGTVADVNNDGADGRGYCGSRRERAAFAQRHLAGQLGPVQVAQPGSPNRSPLGFGDGATVIAWTGKVPIRRTVGSSSYLSQDSHLRWRDK